VIIILNIYPATLPATPPGCRGSHSGKTATSATDIEQFDNHTTLLLKHVCRASTATPGGSRLTTGDYYRISKRLPVLEMGEAA
jgi:hypothetical protein